jgi:hypothetical protein
VFSASDYGRRERFVHRKTSAEPGNLENLFHQALEAAHAELAAFALQCLRQRDETAKAHAADVSELTRVYDQAFRALSDAGVALLLELRGILGIHSAGDGHNDLIRYTPSFDLHRGNNRTLRVQVSN